MVLKKHLTAIALLSIISFEVHAGGPTAASKDFFEMSLALPDIKSDALPTYSPRINAGTITFGTNLHENFAVEAMAGTGLSVMTHQTLLTLSR